MNKDVDVWLCQGEKVRHYKDYFYSLLSAQEKKRALRYKFKQHQQLFIISHGFTRSVLSKYLDVAPQKIDFIKLEYGKPSISFPKKSTLKFNLSHTEDISILAVTTIGDIGIDIECINRKADWQAISQRFYTESEQKALSQLSSEVEQKRAFYELWTRKEAYMKVLGTGLSLPPSGFTLSVPPENPLLIKHHFNKYKSNKNIVFKKIKFPIFLDKFCATMAVELLESENYKYYTYEYSTPKMKKI